MMRFIHLDRLMAVIPVPSATMRMEIGITISIVFAIPDRPVLVNESTVAILKQAIKDQRAMLPRSLKAKFEDNTKHGWWRVYIGKDPNLVSFVMGKPLPAVRPYKDMKVVWQGYNVIVKYVKLNGCAKIVPDYELGGTMSFEYYWVDWSDIGFPQPPLNQR